LVLSICPVLNIGFVAYLHAVCGRRLRAAGVNVGVLPIPSLDALDHVNRSILVCRRCDYDLTGSTSGVCPECGLKFLTPGRTKTGASE
jgi:hypothetical protein